MSFFTSYLVETRKKKTMSNLSTTYHTKKPDDAESARRLLKKLRIALFIWLTTAVLYGIWYTLFQSS